MSRSIPIALMQLPASPSLDALEAEVQATLRRFPHTELIVFPELHLETLADAAHLDPAEHESLGGPKTQRLAEIARTAGIWLIPGSILESADDAVYNTLPVFSPTGELVASYRKIFPWRPYEKVRPGTQIVSFDIPDRGRIGLTICYDAWFPEIHRQLAWQGCDAIINIVLTSTIDREQELVLARANAIVNQVYIASVNAATPTGVGQSMVVDPEGRVRSHSVDANPTVITDVLRLGTVDEVREQGTDGLNCLWKQFQAGDAPLELPVYEGRISPENWAAKKR